MSEEGTIRGLDRLPADVRRTAEEHIRRLDGRSWLLLYPTEQGEWWAVVEQDGEHVNVKLTDPEGSR